MSKRYGRNQKRRHREQIEELQRQKHTLIEWERVKAVERDLLEHKLRAQEAHITEIVDTINGIVQFSAITPPQECRYLDPTDNLSRLRLVRRRRCRTVDMDPAELYDSDILELNLWELRTFIEDRIGIFEEIVHVLIPDGKAVCYKITRNAFEHFRRGGLPELGRQLYGQIMGVLRSMLVS